MKSFATILFVILFAVPTFADDRHPLNVDVQEAHGRVGAPSDAFDPSSDTTLVVEYSRANRQLHVVGRTNSLLEQSYSPTGEDLVDGPHAIFVLPSGETIMKGVLYKWRDADTVQIAIPYADRWNVRTIFMDGFSDHVNHDVIEPLSLTGQVLRNGAATAPELVMGGSRSGHLGRVASQSETCIALGGAACGVGSDGQYLYPVQCYSCWWDFCRAPRNRCA
jgi:hypothetical protein